MHGKGLSHSPGEMRPRMKRHTETPRYAAPMHHQTPVENGDMKESREGGCLLAFRYKMEMPKFMKGIVKSTALSRSEVMVRSVIARSARCDKEKLETVLELILKSSHIPRAP